MLTSLKIAGFRTFESLTIEDLGRVNLFVGENGSGKTAVLEAVELLVKGALRTTIVSQLKSRKEYLYQKGDRGESSFLDADHLFYGYQMVDGTSFCINDLKANVFDPRGFSDLSACLNLTRPDEDEPVSIALSPEGGISSQQPVSLNPKNYSGKGTPHFARFPSIERGNVAEMWDDITLSPTEDLVIEAVKLIDPRIEGIRTLQNGEIVVKIGGVEKRLSLGNLGEGVSRMLLIALTVADSEGSTALIDEIDTGLHYSVMEKMWRMVIETARKLDVQVFATTHSLDCLEGLARLYERDPEATKEVMVFRLHKGMIKAISYTPENIAVACDSRIEVR